MGLATGSQLGSYQVTGLLGAGGMGEVYRARDLKLGREVAIKVLPIEFARDPDRIARFHREAQAIAALNHSNIAGIHGLEESGDSKFLVLELVEGETVEERIRRSPIQIEETLNIAHQICEALEAAHEKGLIHRDLKPANIKITPDGKVKILDFGLAKALDQVPNSATMSNSPTLSLAGTLQGMILGTAGYMSPEQAKGFNADQRSDIFSFGCVLYEMLTRKRTFDGDTVSEILASVLKIEPDWNSLPTNLNPKLCDLLRRCLEKNPRRRWYAIGDVRNELETIRATVDQPIIPTTQVSQTNGPLWKRVVVGSLLLVLGGLITWTIAWRVRPTHQTAITRFTISLGSNERFTNGGRHMVAISPDGSQMVYVANRRLYLRSMSDVVAHPIRGSEADLAGVTNPVFSPDGHHVAFYFSNDQTLRRIPVDGGVAVTLCSSPNPFGISWSGDSILFGMNQGIMRVPASGGTPEILARANPGEIFSSPQMLPGNEAFIFTRSDKAQILLQMVKSGERRVLFEGAMAAQYVPTGHLVYAVGGSLVAVPFDLRKLVITGPSSPILEGVLRAPSGNGGAAQFSFSNTGSLTYVPGPVVVDDSRFILALIDRTQAVKPLDLPVRGYGHPRVSPDGTRVAFDTSESESKEATVWIYDLSGSSAMRPLTVGGVNRYPIWSADGERIAFTSTREGGAGIFWQKADGSGTAERLTKAEEGTTHIPDSWSKDGKTMSFSVDKGTESGIWLLSLPDKKIAPFAQVSGARLMNSIFSPDAKWLAYQSNETKRNEIYVQPFPAAGGTKYQISNDSTSHHPLWSRDGNEMFFVPGAGRFSTLGIRTHPVFSFSGAVTVNRTWREEGPNAVRNMDIMPDGKQWIGVVLAGVNESYSQIQVVLNWFEDLKQRVR